MSAQPTRAAEPLNTVSAAAPRGVGRRRLRALAGILAGTVVVTAAAPFIGASTTPPFVGAGVISPWGALTGSLGETVSAILWQVRLPRVLLSFLAGAGLAVSGMAFQALFRNPLATPFTLGVSSGASLGAAAYIVLGVVLSLPGLPGASAAAFVGAVFAIAIVYGLTRVKRGFSTATMLLAGVALNFFFSSLILFMQYVCRSSWAGAPSSSTSCTS
jgi:iron complex transport system permease protein